MKSKSKVIHDCIICIPTSIDRLCGCQGLIPRPSGSISLVVQPSVTLTPCNSVSDRVSLKVYRSKVLENLIPYRIRRRYFCPTESTKDDIWHKLYLKQQSALRKLHSHPPSNFICKDTKKL